MKVAESVTGTGRLRPLSPVGLGCARYAGLAYFQQEFCWVSPFPEPMSLIPRWRYMTDEAKALTKRTAVSALVVLVVLLVFRALVPWVLVAVVAWWIWKAVRR